MGRALTCRLLLAAAVAAPATLAALDASPAARADDFPPITDRDYALDIYQGAALGSVRIVGMGGTNVALADGSAGMAGNPAAPAIRPATSNRTWDWDWHFDWLNPRLGSDFDNNGERAATGVADTLVLTGGLVGRYRSWAIGLNAGTTSFVVDSGVDRVRTQTQVVRGAIARSFPSLGATFGIGARVGLLTLHDVTDATRPQTLFEITGTSFEAGGVWHPAEANFRAGASVALPVTGDEVTAATCDPEDCHGYILPNRVVVPWQASAGVAWRAAGTPWNRQVPTRWRDERSVLVAADVVVTGRVRDGYGIEAFVDRSLQPSGRSVSVSVRAGTEWELRPGWFRLRGGTYWEPGRFDGVTGRIHATGGLDVRFWSFCFWSERYRARLSLTTDLAPRYGNVGVSIGLWH